MPEPDIFADIRPKPEVDVFADIRPAPARRTMPVALPPYPPPPDEPGLESQGLGPLELLTLANPVARAAAGARALSGAVPWWSAAARTGAAANAVYAALAGLTRLGQPENHPVRDVANAAAVGALLGPPAEGLARNIGAALKGRPTPRTASSATVLDEAAETAAAPGAPARLLPPGDMPARQPFTGQTAQQPLPGSSGVIEQMRADQAFLRRLNELGGGRVVTNAETLAEAWKAGPLEPEAIAATRANTPMNAVEQTRALITADFYWQRFLKGLQSGDDAAADAAFKTVATMQPGLENIRAVGGRTTQAQAMFVQDRVARVYAELADMRQRGLPMDEIRRHADAALTRLERDADFARNWASFREAMDGLETFATRAKLTSPMTHAFNTTSNALTNLITRPAEKLATGGVKLAQGNVSGGLADIRYAFATRRGYAEGLRRFAQAFAPGAEEMGKAGEYRKGRLWQGRARFVDPFRHLSAADAFWKGILEDVELHSRAFESGHRKGLRGDALARHITDLVNDPPAAWANKAAAYAEEHTFQADPGKIVNAIARGIGAVPGGRLVVPFIRTPFNLARYQAQRSPLGILSPRNLRDIASGGDAQAEATARLLVGTGLALGAWSLASEMGDNITGAYPRDQKEREAWEQTGRQAYSVKMGDRWVSYNRFQPVSTYIAQAVELRDAIAAGDEKGVGELYTRLAADGARATLDLPFLSGLSAFFDMLQDPQRQTSRFTQNVVTGFIPNIARDIRYQTDEVKREGRGVVPGVLNMLPGASQRLEPKLSAFGDTLRYDRNRLLRATKLVQPATDTEGGAALLAASRASQEADPLGKPELGLKGVELTRFRLDVARADKAAAAEVLSSREYREADALDRRRILDAARSRARSVVRKEWRKRLRAAGGGTK